MDQVTLDSTPQSARHRQIKTTASQQPIKNAGGGGGGMDRRVGRWQAAQGGLVHLGFRYLC